MSKLDDELRTRGWKITPQRSLILEILREAKEHLTAEEIALRARHRQPNLSAGTVYRNLNTLCALELVNRTNFQGRGHRYEINRGHHHHLVCLNCGHAVEIDFCPMNKIVGKITDGSGFQVEAHNFEITGYCKQCKESEK